MATMISEVYDAFRAGGTPEAQAREAAEALSAESLSTKGDIDAAKGELNRKIDAVKEELNLKIDAVKEELNRKIDAVKEELNLKIDAVEEKLSREIAGVESEVARLARDMAVMKWMMALVLAVQVIPLLKSLLAI